MPSPLTLPAGYTITKTEDGVCFALHSADYGEIGEGDYMCWAAACAAAMDHVEDMASEAAQDEAEQLLPAELDRLYSIVNAQGGYFARTDAAGQARNRAVSIVLAAIDSISAPAASQKEAA